MVLLLLILFLLLHNQQKLRTLGVFVFVSVESGCSGMISAIINNKYLLKRALSIFKNYSEVLVRSVRLVALCLSVTRCRHIAYRFTFNTVVRVFLRISGISCLLIINC